MLILSCYLIYNSHNKQAKGEGRMDGSGRWGGRMGEGVGEMEVGGEGKGGGMEKELRKNLSAPLTVF